jgi:threonine aldolase
MSKSPFDIFDSELPAAPPPAAEPESSRVVAAEALAKLKRNLDLALERHEEILSQPIAEEVDVRKKRLVAEVATATVKAALTTDKTALKARSDNVIERVLLRAVYVRLKYGLSVRREDVERLRTTPRKELEAAFNVRELFVRTRDVFRFECVTNETD